MNEAIAILGLPVLFALPFVWAASSRFATAKMPGFLPRYGIGALGLVAVAAIGLWISLRWLDGIVADCVATPGTLDCEDDYLFFVILLSGAAMSLVLYLATTPVIWLWQRRCGHQAHA